MVRARALPVRLEGVSYVQPLDRGSALQALDKRYNHAARVKAATR
jgi:hypothetical protein